jgi:hypothetical protein
MNRNGNGEKYQKQRQNKRTQMAELRTTAKQIRLDLGSWFGNGNIMTYGKKQPANILEEPLEFVSMVSVSATCRRNYDGHTTGWHIGR